MKVEVAGSFFSPACRGCEVQNSCEAGGLFKGVDEDVQEAVIGIIARHEDKVAAEVAIGGNVTAEQALRRDLEGARQRARTVRCGLEKALAAAVRAQNEWTSDKIPIDARQEALEATRDEILVSLPHPTERLREVDVLDTLQEAAIDIVRFGSQGICNALNVEVIEP